MSNIAANNNDTVGGLIISEAVIADIAKNASKDIEGVSGFVSRPADIKGLFKKGSPTGSVKVTERENELVLDVYITLKNGAKIPVVCEKVQKSIKEAVQNTTGRVISKVNINVAGIDFQTEDKEKTQD